MGAAGMTYEKGTQEAYGKQVYDHYLAMDTTINATVDDKVGVTSRLGQAVGGGASAGRGVRAAAELARQPAARRDQAAARPDYTVCGYFFQPGAAHG